LSNEYFEQLAKLATDLSRRTRQLDEMMQALYNVNSSIQDKTELKKMINLLSKFNKPKPAPNPPTKSLEKSPKKSLAKPPENKPIVPPLTSEQKDDFMYHLFNSPAMMSVIKEHYNKKKKK
jgi:hypothetical protein